MMLGKNKDCSYASTKDIRLWCPEWNARSAIIFLRKVKEGGGPLQRFVCVPFWTLDWISCGPWACCQLLQEAVSVALRSRWRQPPCWGCHFHPERFGLAAWAGRAWQSTWPCRMTVPWMHAKYSLVFWIPGNDHLCKKPPGVVLVRSWLYAVCWNSSSKPRHQSGLKVSQHTPFNLGRSLKLFMLWHPSLTPSSTGVKIGLLVDGCWRFPLRAGFSPPDQSQARLETCYALIFLNNRGKFSHNPHFLAKTPRRLNYRDGTSPLVVSKPSNPTKYIRLHLHVLENECAVSKASVVLLWRAIAHLIRAASSIHIWIDPRWALKRTTGHRLVATYHYKRRVDR